VSALQKVETEPKLVAVRRKFNPARDSIARAQAFHTPRSQWVVGVLAWSTGYTELVWESVDAARRFAQNERAAFRSRVQGNES